MTEAKFGIGRVTRFYVPLLLQGFTQSLTYPLVAGIVTHGPGGVHSLTAFSQGLMIMFMIGALGAGLVTTGLVFARTWYGYLSFKRLNGLMMGVLLLLQCLPAIDPFYRWLFEGFFALPPDLAGVSRWILVAGVVMNGGFFLRNVPIVVLFNNLESGKANNATILRIAVTVACAVVFPRIGWTGPAWGLFTLTFGVLIELLVTWLAARPYVRDLRTHCCVESGSPVPPARQIVALTWEQFRFTLPLALGGFLLAGAPLVIAAFVGHSANAADMLAIHYVTIGVANPVAYAALRLQTVSVRFPPEYPRDRRLLTYAVVAGLVLGLVPFLLSLPAVGNWYFGVYQNMPAALLDTARLASLLYAALPIVQAVRAYVEGLAAARKNPRAVMNGQIAYTLSMVIVCAALLAVGVPGWALAVTAVSLAPVCTTFAISWTLERYSRIISPVSQQKKRSDV